MVPKLPSDPDAWKRLGKNLEIMGLGSRILNFPWTIVNQDMVEELTQACPIPAEVRHVLQRGDLHYITEQMLVDLYGTSTEGDERPLKSHGRHKCYFAAEKDSTDGYLVETCNNAGMKDIFWFLCPILDPTRPS
jgi:hypothetical protein